MSDAHHTLISLLLPAGMLEYFDLIQVTKTEQGLQVHLEEKNMAPAGNEPKDPESKGFLPTVTVEDFPIRGQKVSLQIKRRRWQVKQSGLILTRNWNLVQKGTRITREFVAFF